jgi:hypothetical protein
LSSKTIDPAEKEVIRLPSRDYRNKEKRRANLRLRKEILVLSSKVGRRKENPKELLEIGLEGGEQFG